MIKKLFLSFIFLAPFTSFFALSAWLRLPVIANQLLFFITVIGIFFYGKIKAKWIFKEDLYLLSLLLLVWISFLLGFKEKRSFNHTLAYTNAIIFFFFLSKYVITHLKITSIQISKTIYYSFLFSTIIMLIDFIGINFFKFSLRNIFSAADGKISNMDYYIRSGFKRVGGVAEEPGTMALFYNIYFGITLYYLTKIKKNKHIKYCVLLFIFSHFVMFSNAGIALSLFGFIIIFLFEKLDKKSISKKQINWILLFTLILSTTLTLLFLFNIGNIRLHFFTFLDKMTFNESGKVTSSGQRIIQWKRAFNNFLSHPLFGHGPGYGVHEDKEGYLSVYLTILSDVGMIALTFFIAFQRSVLKKAIKFSYLIRPFLLFALLTSFIHLTIVSDFYHAPFWILLMLVQLIHVEEKNEKV